MVNGQDAGNDFLGMTADFDGYDYDYVNHSEESYDESLFADEWWDEDDGEEGLDLVHRCKR